MCTTPSCSTTLLKSFDVKFVPLSVCMVRGNPTFTKKFIMASTIFLVVIDFSGIASGNLAVAHIDVWRYLFPAFVCGSGPTQSIKTLLKGSSAVGIGFIGAGGIFWLSLPVFWHIWPEPQNVLTSFSPLAHKNVLTTYFRSLLYPNDQP